jgi:rubredoxin
VDQFQVIVEGEGLMGRHHVQPGVVHFSRAYTPYGPILWGDKGMMLLTIRPRPDSKGAHYMPDSREELNSVRRKPFQTSHQVVFPETITDVHAQVIPGIEDNAGLSAYAYTLKAGAQALAPDPSTGGGQWILVMKGSMIHEGKAWPAFSIAELTPDERAYRMQAGPDGLHAIALSFSRPDAQGANSSDMKARATGASTWICELCGFVYDEAVGIPDEGIAPGTRWEDVPETWTCPDCATTKSDFKMVQV